MTHRTQAPMCPLRTQAPICPLRSQAPMCPLRTQSDDQAPMCPLRTQAPICKTVLVAGIHVTVSMDGSGLDGRSVN